MAAHNIAIAKVYRKAKRQGDLPISLGMWQVTWRSRGKASGKSRKQKFMAGLLGVKRHRKFFNTAAKAQTFMDTLIPNATKRAPRKKRVPA